VLTIGYDEVGTLGGFISIDVREMRDSKGGSVRGVVAEVTESQYRKERSFVDSDELPDLLKGFDALLGIDANPTQFKSFEVRYTTRGGFQLAAFNTDRGILYSVQAGRTTPARHIGLSATDVRKIRGAFDVALQKLATLK
jgi:hypothetical protein